MTFGPLMRMMPASKILLPWQTLITALGGNLAAGGASDSVVPAWWDPLANVTLVSSAVSAIPEVRSTSGLTMTPNGINAAYNATTGAVTLNSSTGTFATPSTTVLDTSTACSLVIIANGLSGGSWYAALYASGLLGLIGQAGFYSGAAGSQSNYATSTLASTDTGLRLFIVSAGAGAVNIDIPNKTRVTATQSAPGAGANALTIGNYQPGGSQDFSTLLACGFIKRVVTSTDITALKTYAATKGYAAA